MEPDTRITPQETVCTTREFADGKGIGLIHHNRVFGASNNLKYMELAEEQVPLVLDSDSNSADPGQRQIPPRPSSRDLLEQIILRLQTTAKYRVLNSQYIAFRVIDNVMFLVVILVSVVNAINFDENQIQAINEQQAAVFTVIVIELFYDIMLICNQYWGLQRLSLWIGLELFSVYFGLVFWIKNWTFITLVTIRFIAYILEELLDVAIDIEMHNDIYDYVHDDIRKGWMSISTNTFRDFPYKPTPEYYLGSFLASGFHIPRSKAA